MYVFTSAIFFLVFFAFFSDTDAVKIDTDYKISGKTRLKSIAKLEKKFANDSTKKELLLRLVLLKDTTVPISVTDMPLFVQDNEFLSVTGATKKYKTLHIYDSIQKSLPANEKDGWFKRKVIQKELAINAKYASNPAEAGKNLSSSFLHRLPYLLFVSLPLFALILRLVYIRRKQFYFADHGIFTIHLYVFSFILLLLAFCLNSLESLTHLGFINYLVGALFILLVIYLYKAMRYFYGQGRMKTLAKLMLIFLLSLFLMFILIIFFLLFSAYTL